MIRVDSLSVCFGDVDALWVPQLEIGTTGRTGICGRNGSGKSTLLRVLAGLQRPSSGSVTGLFPPGETVLLHQQPYLFQGSVLHNIEYALRLRGRPVGEAHAYLERLGVVDLASRPAPALSGGERRRVAIARALAAVPRLLLLDEPFAPLDEEAAAIARAALERFPGAIVIAAPQVTEPACDRIVELTPRPSSS